MTIVAFEPPRRRSSKVGWKQDEFAQLLQFYAALCARRPGLDYEIGATERDEPQFYVVDPDAEQPCVACVSRLRQGGGWYVIEDGCGTTLVEGVTLAPLIRTALAERGRLPRRVGALVSGLVALLAPWLWPDEEPKPDLLVGFGATLFEIILPAAPTLAAIA